MTWARSIREIWPNDRFLPRDSLEKLPTKIQIPSVPQTTYHNFRKKFKVWFYVNSRSPWGKAYGSGSVDFTKTRTARCSQKDGKLLREAFLGNLVPVGQIESGLLVSEESNPLRKSTERKRNHSSKRWWYWVSKIAFLHGKSNERRKSFKSLLLTCQGPECEDLFCNHGCYKAANKDCHKVLGESEMFTLLIDFPTPLNFLREKCFWGKWNFFESIR